MCSTTTLETFITDKALSPAEVALREAARDYRTLAEAVNGTDVFLGCSAPGVLTQDPPGRSD